MQSRIPTYIFSLFIPLALVIGCFGFYNRVEPRILGFPFIYAWIFACFFLVSASMCIGWLLVIPSPTGTRNGLPLLAHRRRMHHDRSRFHSPYGFFSGTGFYGETRRHCRFDG
ncbi:MAG: DUF3311 domain-containing protein [Bilophila wadsworthia]|uniref:DUF3311 domain-containing protein n=1 Tax=Bilophila wadsworthia TaxID=35833 RepID=UPI00242BD781|nr:DUF3311 domain-containing protein [Bilophila wadsworthia]MCI6540791.1 DUF3311 domain-containing protein [Bilophila wadsworthia]